MNILPGKLKTFKLYVEYDNNITEILPIEAAGSDVLETIKMMLEVELYERDESSKGPVS